MKELIASAHSREIYFFKKEKYRYTNRLKKDTEVRRACPSGKGTGDLGLKQSLALYWVVQQAGRDINNVLGTTFPAAGKACWLVENFHVKTHQN